MANVGNIHFRQLGTPHPRRRERALNVSTFAIAPVFQGPRWYWDLTLKTPLARFLFPPSPLTMRAGYLVGGARLSPIFTGDPPLCLAWGYPSYPTPYYQ